MQPTPADADLLRRLAEPGASIRSVAADLSVSDNVIEHRLRKMYRRLGVNSQLQAWVKLHGFPRLP